MRPESSDLTERRELVLRAFGSRHPLLLSHPHLMVEMCTETLDVLMDVMRCTCGLYGGLLQEFAEGSAELVHGAREPAEADFFESWSLPVNQAALRRFIGNAWRNDNLTLAIDVATPEVVLRRMDASLPDAFCDHPTALAWLAAWIGELKWALSTLWIESAICVLSYVPSKEAEVAEIERRLRAMGRTVFRLGREPDGWIWSGPKVVGNGRVIVP